MTTTLTSRPLRTSRLAATLALLAALATPATLLAQARELKQALTPGTSVSFDHTLDMTLDFSMLAMGQNIQMDMTADDAMRGTLTVDEVGPDGRPTRATIAFAPGLGTKIVAAGQNQNAPFALAGQTVTVTRTGESVAVQGAEADEQTLERIRSVMNLGSEMLPGRPVSPGDTWQVADANMIDGAKTTTLTLVGFSERGGREVAEVRIDGDIGGDVPNMPGAAMDGTLGGTALIDATTGVVLTAQLSGDASFSADQVQGMEAEIDGTMLISAGQTNTPEGAVPAAPAVPDAQAPAAQTPAAPATPPTTPPTPPATPAAAGGFAGEYEGDGLKLIVLQPVGGATPVQIVRGGDTYDGSITSINGESFSGSFNAAGSSFPFTGSRTGDGIAFTSGSRTYNLKTLGGSGGANPLE